jgi:two-component system, chemotaxis family, protein-glutamate methylesterase/glutaminase
VSPIDVIVVGGSAGALDALLTIVSAVPDAVSCPIVIVLHLPRARPNLVPELLSRACSRAVYEAEDKTPLCDRAIYVGPPDYHLLIERNRSLALSVDEPIHCSRPAIDVLFESAADAYGPAVAGLVLSGANEDGSEGLCRIRDAGGVAIVQAPQTAPVPLMPEAALRRVGGSAHVVPLGDLGGFLGRLAGAGQRDGEAPP